jgi:DNA-directed RNA polymerase sigma subunit (sigma70/sigma32)
LTDLFVEILRLSRRMRSQAGRGPSAAELAGYLHLPLAEVRAALLQAKDLAAGVSADGGKDASVPVPGGLAEALTGEEERALCRRLAASLNEDLARENARPGVSVTGERIREIETPEGS